MFRNWIRVDRLMVDLIPHLGPTPSMGSTALRKTCEAPHPLNGHGPCAQPTWLTPAYLRQYRSGDRISRLR